jgi:hypothetical protein
MGDLHGFHHRGLARVFMVVAQQMQNRVHGQVGGMFCKGFALFDRFPPDNPVSQGDIAEIGCEFRRRGKRKNIGHFRPIAEPLIEIMQALILCKENRYLGSGRQTGGELQSNPRGLSNRPNDLPITAPLCFFNNDRYGGGALPPGRHRSAFHPRSRLNLPVRRDFAPGSFAS